MNQFCFNSNPVRYVIAEKKGSFIKMNSNIVKPEKFDHLHLVYYFTVPLKVESTRFLLVCFLSLNQSTYQTRKKAF